MQRCLRHGPCVVLNLRLRRGLVRPRTLSVWSLSHVILFLRWRRPRATGARGHPLPDSLAALSLFRAPVHCRNQILRSLHRRAWLRCQYRGFYRRGPSTLACCLARLLLSRHRRPSQACHGRLCLQLLRGLDEPPKFSADNKTTLHGLYSHGRDSSDCTRNLSAAFSLASRLPCPAFFWRTWHIDVVEALRRGRCGLAVYCACKGHAHSQSGG